MENLQHVKDFYQERIYGRWRSGEKVSFDINRVSQRKEVTDPNNPFASMFKLSTDDEGIDVVINVSREGKSVSFTVRVYIPSIDRTKYPAGCPFIVCMHPIAPKDYALNKGYGLIFMDTSMIAEDNNLRKGCFYDLYPYSVDANAQTGELMAWSWGASKVLDAIDSGLGKAIGFDGKKASITGVSRWGKATAVCGAFEGRFQNVIPVCSGAGGLALWSYQSEGKSYDLTHCGGPKDYVYGQNEPLSCLQSEAEQGWFIDRFLEYKTYDDIEVEQYMLPILAAKSQRKYIIVAAWMGEDWVNAPAMWACYEKALEGYKELGLSNNLYAFFHKEGHAVLKEDLEKIFEVI